MFKPNTTRHFSKTCYAGPDTRFQGCMHIVKALIMDPLLQLTRRHIPIKSLNLVFRLTCEFSKISLGSPLYVKVLKICNVGCDAFDSKSHLP